MARNGYASRGPCVASTSLGASAYVEAHIDGGYAPYHFLGGISLQTFWGCTFHGVLPEWVTAEIWRLGHYDRPTTQLLLERLKAGGTFVDIGAHFGYFSMLASLLVGPRGKVLAVEPMPATFGRLRHNIEPMP